MIKHLNRDAGHWLESSPLPCLIFFHTQQGFGVTMTRSLLLRKADHCGQDTGSSIGTLGTGTGTPVSVEPCWWHAMIRPFLLVIPILMWLWDTMSVWCLIVMEAVVEDNRVQYMMGVCESGWAREREREREREHDDHTHKLCVKLKAHSPSVIYVWKVKERG